jgi:serine phosphatase RsbU (regulator of sigma subunit)
MKNNNNKRYQGLLEDDLLNIEMRSQQLSGWLLAATIVIMNIFAQADHAPYMQSFVNFTQTLSGGLVIWFLGTAILIGRGIYHPAFKYLNLLLQVSTVTFYMLATARLVDANFALTSTAPLFYLLIIGLTSLALNPLLSFLAGILAAIQFIGAYALRLEETTFMPGLESSEGAWIQIALKGFMFIMMGVTAMLIAKSSRRLLEKVVSQVIYEEQIRLLEDDMEQAAEIQEKLIPDSDINPNYYQIESFYSPARQVGGDYFDIIQLSHDRCLIVIADVSGKGYSAALLMSNIQAMVKTLANQDFTLAHMADFINQSVLHNSVRGKFVTIVFMILDPHQQNLQYINCGHNPPLMVKGSTTVVELNRAGTALGVMEDYQYEVSDVDFSPGDIILGYTDGLSELRDTQGRQLGINNIKKILQINNQLDPTFIKQYLLASIYEHASETEVSDDLSFVCIQAKSSQSDQAIDQTANE